MACKVDKGPRGRGRADRQVYKFVTKDEFHRLSRWSLPIFQNICTCNFVSSSPSFPSRKIFHRTWGWVSDGGENAHNEKRMASAAAAAPATAREGQGSREPVQCAAGPWAHEQTENNVWKWEMTRAPQTGTRSEKEWARSECKNSVSFSIFLEMNSEIALNVITYGY